MRRTSIRKTDLKAPRCIIIAGPNGAGKTTFAREFLPKEAEVTYFVNADLIASGLSPLRPDLAVVTAGRLFLSELDRLAKARLDFAFESTLSGPVYLKRLGRWKEQGYRIENIFYRWSPLVPTASCVESRGVLNKAGITSGARMSCGGLYAGGTISKQNIVFPLMRGRCMITQERYPYYWLKNHEEKKRDAKYQDVCGFDWASIASCRAVCSKNRACARDADLCLGGWQGRSTKTVI